MPPELAPTIGHTEAARRAEIVLATLLPYEAHATAEAWHLCGLGVALDLALTQIKSEGLLRLGRQILVAEDCRVSQAASVTFYSQTTDRSATRSASSSFCWSVRSLSWRPTISVCGVSVFP